MVPFVTILVCKKIDLVNMRNAEMHGVFLNSQQITNGAGEAGGGTFGELDVQRRRRGSWCLRVYPNKPLGYGIS